MDYHISNAIVRVLFGSVMCSLFCFVPLWGPRLVYGRIRAAQTVPARSFSMIDALLLTFYLATANAALTAARNQLSAGGLISMAVQTNLLLLLVWIKCQDFMNRRSIKEQRSRLIIQIVLYPASLISIGIAIFSALMLVSKIPVFQFGLLADLRRYYFSSFLLPPIAGLSAASISVILSRIAFQRWIEPNIVTCTLNAIGPRQTPRGITK